MRDKLHNDDYTLICVIYSLGDIAAGELGGFYEFKLVARFACGFGLHLAHSLAPCLDFQSGLEVYDSIGVESRPQFSHLRLLKKRSLQQS